MIKAIPQFCSVDGTCLLCGGPVDAERSELATTYGPIDAVATFCRRCDWRRVDPLVSPAGRS